MDKLGEYRTVYEHWKDKLGYTPDEKTLAALEVSIQEWKANVDDWKNTHDKNIANDYEANHLKIERQGIINEKKALLKKLSGLLKKHKTGEITTSDYGTHQANRDWLIKTFKEQEQVQPSQNKTVEKVKSLYKKEYGLSIGKTTILRAVGKAD